MLFFFFFFLDWLVKMETIDEDWEVLLKYFGKEIPKEIELARKNYHRALNDTNVSDEVKQKICQIAAPDYCCLVSTYSHRICFFFHFTFMKVFN